MCWNVVSRFFGLFEYYLVALNDWKQIRIGWQCVTCEKHVKMANFFMRWFKNTIGKTRTLSFKTPFFDPKKNNNIYIYQTFIVTSNETIQVYNNRTCKYYDLFKLKINERNEKKEAIKWIKLRSHSNNVQKRLFTRIDSLTNVTRFPSQ